MQSMVPRLLAEYYVPKFGDVFYPFGYGTPNCRVPWISKLEHHEYEYCSLVAEQQGNDALVTAEHPPPLALL